jgi:hypothetical protein
MCLNKCLSWWILALLLMPSRAASSNACWTKSDSALRHRTQDIKEPAYPAQAITDRVTGVVVVDICVDMGSDHAVIENVFGGNTFLRESARSAVAQWRFVKPEALLKDKPHPYGGKLVFYYVQEKGVWRVMSATDSFYVGPRFAAVGARTNK